MNLKAKIQQYARDMGADLVGFGSIDRCKHAPPMMSPQGIMPTARTVVVMGIHHPDACIELGGESHPQEIGPYSVQYLMNSRLDEMSYRMGSFIESLGHGAVPIVSSNIWRYNQYKDLTAIFAPDISHIYMAVVAGLAEIGYNGLALTPQYGARNRFVTVITDAEIEADPLLPPGSVCDDCMLCRKHCPTKAFDKEVAGEKVLRIDPYEYRFPNKNLWRCAWGEHFDIDLDLQIPEVVNEQVLLDTVAKHGVRSGEMGQCLKFCVPKPWRTFERNYSRTPMRRYEMEPLSGSALEEAAAPLLQVPLQRGTERLLVTTAEQLKQHGIELEQFLPGARSAVTLLVTTPASNDDDYAFRFGAQYQIDGQCYDLTRGFEKLGHRSLMTIARSGSHVDPIEVQNPTEHIIAALLGDLQGRVVANTVITRAALSSRELAGAVPSAANDDLTQSIMMHATTLGADLAGVAPLERLEALQQQLKPLYEGQEVLDAVDHAIRFTAWKPEIKVRRRKVKHPSDWLPGAKSVFVFGLRYHKSVLETVTKPPAEAVGPYTFGTYVTNWLGSIIGYQLVKHLESRGYKARLASDLFDTDSMIGNPRGPQPDLFTNRFAGLAAGLGYLTTSGHLATPQYGIRQRLIAIVTDAPLTATPMLPHPGTASLCHDCDEPCLKSCPSQAFCAKSATIELEGVVQQFRMTDQLRCDWVKRYGLMGDSGFKYLGSTTDIAPPAEITPAVLDGALRQLDKIVKIRPTATEPCVINCPYATSTS